MASDRGSPTNSQGSGEERKKKTSRDKSQARTESAGQKPKLLAEKKKETPKVDKRKTRDKAKQLSENKNSLRRMKKREEVKNLVHRLPSEVKSSRSSGTGGLYDSILGNGDYGGTQDIVVERGKHCFSHDVAFAKHDGRKLCVCGGVLCETGMADVCSVAAQEPDVFDVVHGLQPTGRRPGLTNKQGIAKSSE